MMRSVVAALSLLCLVSTAAQAETRLRCGTEGKEPLDISLDIQKKTVRIIVPDDEANIIGENITSIDSENVKIRIDIGGSQGGTYAEIDINRFDGKINMTFVSVDEEGNVVDTDKMSGTCEVLPRLF